MPYLSSVFVYFINTTYFVMDVRIPSENIGFVNECVGRGVGVDFWVPGNADRSADALTMETRYTPLSFIYILGNRT